MGIFAGLGFGGWGGGGVGWGVGSGQCVGGWGLFDGGV